MSMTPIVLVVTSQTATFDAVFQAADQCGIRCEARRVNNAPLALARIAGGGILSVVLDIAGMQDNPLKLRDVRAFRAAAPDVAIILWSDSSAPGLNEIASQTGAIGWLTKESSPQHLNRLLSGAQGNGQSLLLDTIDQPSGMATIIAVMGVRGGVGATTVALNVAAALATRGKVVLAEIGPLFGGLQSCLHPGRMIRGFPNCGDRDAAVTRAVKAQLWPVPNRNGFHVLFGPQTAQDCQTIPALAARDLIRVLAAETEFVVVDLPTSLSEANQEIIGASHHLALVIEPAEGCLRLGNLILEGIRRWERLPGSIATVVVRRDAEGAPIRQERIEAELGLPVLGVIPPARGLCTKGERDGVPLFEMDGDGLVRESFATVARRFPLQSPRHEGPSALPDPLRSTRRDAGNRVGGSLGLLRC